MSESRSPETESRRRAIFASLVEAQDKGLSVPASRFAVTSRFEVPLEEVQRAEREGLKEEWPPL